jgi:hypothetical protein
MDAGCTSTTSERVEMRISEPPPDELVELISHPKRLVRVFSDDQNVKVIEAADAVFNILDYWDKVPSLYWRQRTPDDGEVLDLEEYYPPAYPGKYWDLKSTGYIYKDFYLFQLQSESCVIPMAILVPMDQGIIVVVNPYVPEIGIPWEFDHYTPHDASTE